MQPTPGFDPILVTDEQLEDLSTYTGMSHAECRNRLDSYATKEMAVAWHRAQPQVPEEIMDFYRATDLYIWALMQWHASLDRKPYRDAIDRLCQRLTLEKPRRILDFGCGIGTDALILASRGYEVTLVDVAGPTFDFARHRFRRRGLNADFIESNSPVPNPPGHFDGVICFDVFEHLPDPLGAAKRLVKGLKPEGLLLQQGAFNDEGNHPCHLSEGVSRFAGMRWHINLAGCGLRSEAPLIYVKERGWRRNVQIARFALWRATGLWTVHVSREEV